MRLTSTAVARSLREAKRGSAPGLSGARAEHYKLWLGHADDVELLTEAANLLPQAEVPYVVAEGVTLTRMTAIRKPGGGVRGMARGDMFRRFVSRALAAASVFDQATRPYQFALRTRVGVDALSARRRATLENDARATVVSLDGRSAYDCISRAAFLLKLCDVAPALVPFALALLFYGQTSEYHGGTTTGSATAYPKLRDVNKATDPLAPALFALGQHEALRRADYIRSCGRVNRSWRLSMNSMSFCRTIPCTCRLGFLFVFLRLFAPAKECLVCRSYLQCPTEARARASSGTLAAAKHGELPVHIGQDLMQIRRVPGRVALPCKWEFKQRRGDGAL